MTPHEFPVSIADLDAGGRELKFPVRAAWLRGVLEGTEAGAAGPDGALEVRVSKSGTDVVVRGRVAAELTVPCARCLEEIALHIDQPLTALMVPAGEAKARAGGGDADGAAEELDVMAYSGEAIALDDLVRDELVLEIPMIPLCSEDCPGIKQPAQAQGKGGHGGGDHENNAATIDPRFAPLLRLKKIQEKE